MSKGRKFISFIFLIMIITAVIFGFFYLPKLYKKNFYKVEYAELVEKYAAATQLDKYFIYAVIRTESNFDEKATSNVGARGLMQIMEEAFDWVKYRMNDERDITYADMYTADFNIEYGSHMLMLLKEKYGSEELAIAAYHGGMTTVDNWLSDKNISKDGITIDEIPSDATRHYVNKVMKAWEAYKNLYENE